MSYPSAGEASPDEEEELINAVKQRSVLFKVDEDDYRNAAKKHKAWEEVAFELNKSGD